MRKIKSFRGRSFMKSSKKWCLSFAIVFAVFAAAFMFFMPILNGKDGVDFPVTGMEATICYKEAGSEIFGLSYMNMIPYAGALLGILFTFCGWKKNKFARFLAFLCFAAAGAAVYFTIDFLAPGKALKLIAEAAGADVSAEKFLEETYQKILELDMNAFIAMGAFAFATVMMFISLFQKQRKGENVSLKQERKAERKAKAKQAKFEAKQAKKAAKKQKSAKPAKAKKAAPAAEPVAEEAAPVSEVVEAEPVVMPAEEPAPVVEIAPVEEAAPVATKVEKAKKAPKAKAEKAKKASKEKTVKAKKAPKAKKPAKAKKASATPRRLGYRAFNAIGAIVCIATFFLPIKFLTGHFELENDMLGLTIIDLFTKDHDKAFDLLPVLTTGAGIVGKVACVFYYLLILCTLIAFIYALIGIFSKKHATECIRTSTYFYSMGTMLYALFIGCISAYLDGIALTFDWIVIGLFAVSELVYFVLSCIKEGKKIFMVILEYLLTLAFTVALLWSVASDTDAVKLMFKNEHGSIIRIVIFSILSVAVVNFLIAKIRIQLRRGLPFDLFRFVLQMLLALGLIYIHAWSKVPDDKLQLYATISAAIALLQIVFATAQIVYNVKKKNKAAQQPAEMVDAALVEGAVDASNMKDVATQQYAEAVLYEGGPIAGVELATELCPNTPAPEAESYDAFIITLNEEEKSQFTDLFILKVRGPLAGIPDYKVGETNKDFFRKIFIYLGQNREKIPNGLLSKIYQHSVKLS